MRDWDKLKAELQTSRPQAMYDREIHRFHAELAKEHFADRADLKVQYLAQFDQWLKGSQLNRISGLERFKARDHILGVTQYIDDLHMRYPQELVILPGDYAYHWRLRPDIPQRQVHELRRGDVLIFAMPFPSLGGEHPETQSILDRCLKLNIPVHIDSAWYGCTRGVEFDYSHPAIHSVGFSLSKALGLGANRTGVRYSMERARGPVTIMNDFNMEIRVLQWYGIQFMQHFGADYLQNKYGALYEEICHGMNLRPSKSIHLALREDSEGRFHPVGIRPILRHLGDK